MGTYHTFFVATDADLQLLFPGWARSKPEPVERATKNPFTGQSTTVTEWQPIVTPDPLGTPSLYDDVWPAAVGPIVAPPDGYAAMLEDTCPPGLRCRPHFRSKNLEPLCELEGFAELLLATPTPAPPARLGPRDDDDVPIVWHLPAAAVEELGRASDERCEALSMGLFSTEDAVADVIRPLRSLAATALQDGAGVYHYYALHH